MEIRNRGTDSIEVLGAGTLFRGLWLPADKAQRPKIRNDQVLEIRRSYQTCRDFNVLVTYGNLCDQYEKVVERIGYLLLECKYGDVRVKSRREAIEYILKWFMARVQDKKIQAPRKARPKVKKAKRVTRGVVHLNIGVAGPSRSTACGIRVPLNRTTTLYRGVTCNTCKGTTAYSNKMRRSPWVDGRTI